MRLRTMKFARELTILKSRGELRRLVPEAALITGGLRVLREDRTQTRHAIVSARPELN